jgi:hypothetical protein
MAFRLNGGLGSSGRGSRLSRRTLLALPTPARPLFRSSRRRGQAHRQLPLGHTPEFHDPVRVPCLATITSRSDRRASASGSRTRNWPSTSADRSRADVQSAERGASMADWRGNRTHRATVRLLEQQESAPRSSPPRMSQPVRPWRSQRYDDDAAEQAQLEESQRQSEPPGIEPSGQYGLLSFHLPGA